MHGGDSLKKTAILIVGGAAAMSAALLPFTAEAQNARQAPRTPAAAGICATTATKYKVSETDAATTSFEFVDVAESAIAFVQGKTGCVIISFSALTSIIGGEKLTIRTVFDGNINKCQPGGNNVGLVFESSDATGGGARQITFVCPNVVPGNHAVRMQFATFNGSEAYLGPRTLLVHYVK